MSQQQLADALGVSHSTLAAWEMGRNLPRNLVPAARLIEDTLGVPAWWTLGLSEVPGGGIMRASSSLHLPAPVRRPRHLRRHMWQVGTFVPCAA